MADNTRTEMLAEFRTQYPMYKDMSDDALGTALAMKYPKEYGDLAPPVAGLTPTPPPKQPDLPQGVMANIPGALKETFGMGDRPGAVPLTGNETTKTPLGVILKPQGALERGASAAVQIPATVASGGASAALGAPAVLGRLGASAVLAGAEHAAKEGKPFGWETMIDLALAGGSEAVTAGVSKALKSVGGPKRAFDWITKAAPEALDYVRHRLATTRMLIPSLDATKKLTWDEAIKLLNTKTGVDWKVARQEIANWMNLADKQTAGGGVGPKAGQVFKEMTKVKKGGARMEPSKRAELAEGARDLMPEVAAAGEEEARAKQGGVPQGFLAWEALKSGTGKMIEHLPGVGSFAKAARTMVGQ